MSTCVLLMGLDQGVCRCGSKGRERDKWCPTVGGCEQVGEGLLVDLLICKNKSDCDVCYHRKA